MPVLCHTTV